MKYVYMLQSEATPDRHYVGCTVDLRRRLAEHNAGESPHTAKYAPWSLLGYLAFSDAAKADRFETYLKSASGRSFAKRHF